MPDHVLFGLNWLRHLGHQVNYSDVGFSPSLLNWIISPLQQLFRQKLGIGFQLDQALRLLPSLKKAQVIISTNDSCGLPITLLKKIGLVKTPQIYLHIDFTNHTRSSDPIFYWLTKKLLSVPEKIVCYSQGEINRLYRFWHVPKNKLFFLPPGVDVNFFKPQKQKNSNDILAIGRDINRDYQNFNRAISGLEIKAIIICDPKNISALKLSTQIQVKHNQDYLSIKSAYSQAKIIVIPTKKNTVSGQISLLEALSSGKPVIVANTPALQKTFELKSHYDCLLYQAGSYLQLKKQIRLLLYSQKLQHTLHLNARHVAMRFSSKVFAQGLNKIICSLTP